MKSKLHITVENRDKELCREILTEDITVIDITDEEGETALNLAAKNNDYVTALILLEFNANANLPNHQGVTPLHRAAEHGNHFLCDLLKQHGALITRDNQGLTPLHMAALSDSITTFKILCGNEYNINEVSNDGVTLAHLASLNKDGKVCKMLYQKNANFLIPTKNLFRYKDIEITSGTTALELISTTLSTFSSSESERKNSKLDEIEFFLRRKNSRPQSQEPRKTPQTVKVEPSYQESITKIRELGEQYRKDIAEKRAAEEREKEQQRLKEEASRKRMREEIERRKQERERIKAQQEEKNRQDEEQRKRNFEARQKRDAKRENSNKPYPSPNLGSSASVPLFNPNNDQSLIDILIAIEDRKTNQLRNLEQTDARGTQAYEIRFDRINLDFANKVRNAMIQSIDDPETSEKTKIKRAKIKIHPDKNPDNQEKAQRAMQIMGEAFSILDEQRSR